MTHAHVPTLTIVRYAPKHRLPVPPARGQADWSNNARCSGCSPVGGTIMVKTFCPRHDALSYSTHMAKHATDSLR